MNTVPKFKTLCLGLIWLWLSIFAILPVACLVITSLLPDNTISPTMLQLTGKHYLALCSPLYARLIARALIFGFFTTGLCLCFAYPFAYALNQLHPNHRKIMLFLTLFPFWTSSLLRTYAIIIILKTQGLLNQILLRLHLIETPLLLLFSKTAVLIGLVYNLLPFMILPLYHNLERLEPHVFEAAYDLGASRWRTATKILLPLTQTGIASGCLMVFLPAITLFYIPDLLGGARSILLGNVIRYEFLTAQNWPLGSAIGVCLLFFIILFTHYLQHTSTDD